MKSISVLNFAVFWFACIPLLAQEQSPAPKGLPEGDTWTRTLKDRTKRGMLHDAFERVRGDSGKWNDEPRLLHAPPIKTKPPKTSLDDWADRLERSRIRTLTSKEDNWLLFKTRQLDDNDRVWIERIERRENQFTIVLSEAIWQGRYFKSFTYYNVYGVNLGKLPPGKYDAKWVIQPLVFREFEGSGRPRDQQRGENWSKDERPAKKKASELSVTFTVHAPAP